MHLNPFEQGGQAGREGRGLHWDPQQLLQRRHQVARHRMQAQEANHLPGDDIFFVCAMVKEYKRSFWCNLEL